MNEVFIKIEKVEGLNTSSRFGRRYHEAWVNIHLQYCYEMIGTHVSIYRHGGESYLRFANDSDSVIYTLSRDEGVLEEWIDSHFKTFSIGH